jgi:hypothetical protein
MRFHKAKKISKAEADLIIETTTSSLNDNVVICHVDTWYDVRMLTSRELDALVSDLLRNESADAQAGLQTPH